MLSKALSPSTAIMWANRASLVLSALDVPAWGWQLRAAARCVQEVLLDLNCCFCLHGYSCFATSLQVEYLLSLARDL